MGPPMGIGAGMGHPTKANDVDLPGTERAIRADLYRLIGYYLALGWVSVEMIKGCLDQVSAELVTCDDQSNQS